MKYSFEIRLAMFFLHDLNTSYHDRYILGQLTKNVVFEISRSSIFVIPTPKHQLTFQSFL